MGVFHHLVAFPSLLWFSAMRSLYLLSSFVSVLSATVVYSNEVIQGKTLPEVYGEVDTPSSMEPFHSRPSARADKGSRFTDEYYKHRTEEICDFPIEVVILQDLTESFDDDIANMRATQIALMVEAISTTHPGSAFATVTFRDKPLWPLGNPGDYCEKFGSSMSTDPTGVIADYAAAAASGGGDPPESQFHALVAATQSNTPGWGLVPTAARLIVVATDAAPHFEGDGFNVFNLPGFSGTFNEASHDKQCAEEYYPGPDVVHKSILKRQVYLGALVYDGSHDQSLPIESWKWFNGYLNQTAAFVHDMESDSSNFWEQLSRIITELEDVECGESTTTLPTEPPVTQPPATEPPATQPPATEPPVPTECPPCPEECPPCIPPCVPECDPCCYGVVIKLAETPKVLHLEVQN